MPTVRVTMEAIIDVKITEDLTDDQIRECVEKAIACAKENGFNFDQTWEWVDESKVSRSIDWNPEPPDDCWIEVDGIEWALSHTMAIARHCPVRIKPLSPWTPIDSYSPAYLEAMADLIRSFSSEATPFTGFFDEGVADLLALEGVQVLGSNSSSLGFFVKDDRPFAAVNPTTVYDSTGCVSKIRTLDFTSDSSHGFEGLIRVVEGAIA